METRKHKQSRRNTHEECRRGVRDVPHGLLIVSIHAVYVRLRGVGNKISASLVG
jgi:hypothetical protein